MCPLLAPTTGASSPSSVKKYKYLGPCGGDTWSTGGMTKRVDVIWIFVKDHTSACSISISFFIWPISCVSNSTNLAITRLSKVPRRAYKSARNSDIEALCATSHLDFTISNLFHTSDWIFSYRVVISVSKTCNQASVTL